jgi:tubulin-specific chaperone E
MSGYRTLHRERLGNFPIWHVVTTSTTAPSTSSSSSSSGCCCDCWRLWTACGDGFIRGYLIQEKNSSSLNDSLDSAAACTCTLTHCLLTTKKEEEKAEDAYNVRRKMMKDGCSQVQVLTLPDDSLVVLSQTMMGTVQIYQLDKHSLEHSHQNQEDTTNYKQREQQDLVDSNEDVAIRKTNSDSGISFQHSPIQEFVVDNATGTCMRIIMPRLLPPQQNKQIINPQFNIDANVLLVIPCLDGSIDIVATGIVLSDNSNHCNNTATTLTAGTVIERFSSPSDEDDDNSNHHRRPNIVMSLDCHPRKESIVMAVGRKDGLVEILVSTINQNKNNDNYLQTHCHQRLIHHEAPVRSVAFTPDGHLLATASDDGMVCWWDMSRENITPVLLVNHVPQAHTGWILALQALPDSRRFVSTGADAKIHVWQVDQLGQGPVHTFTSGNTTSTTTSSSISSNSTTASMMVAQPGSDGTDTVDFTDPKRQQDIPSKKSATTITSTASAAACWWTIASYCPGHQSNMISSSTTALATTRNVITTTSTTDTTAMVPRLVSGNENGDIQIYSTARSSRPFGIIPPREILPNQNVTLSAVSHQQQTAEHLVISSRMHHMKSISSPADLIVGETRIRDEDGFVGTVAYVGPVASAKSPTEIYAGIVWDDPCRGKHDGSVICRQTNAIVRHFSCGSSGSSTKNSNNKNHPTQGSFLKLKLLDTGIPLTASLLRSKYVEMNAPVIAPNNMLPHTVTTASGKELPIEFWGELKIRERQQLENIDKISLRRCGIARACTNDDDDDDDDNDTQSFRDFSQIKEMDLAGNLLCHWREVWKIMKQFPNLENFSIAHNYVRDIQDIPKHSAFSLAAGTFDRIQILNLNHCAITSFITLQCVADTMPNLKSLCVANNDLSDLTNYQVRGLDRLQRLDCSNCHWDTWMGQVDKFSHLPLLQWLNLDDNLLPSIPMDAGDGSRFQSLTTLQISGTAISSWMDLEGIQSLSSLHGLRLKNVPLTVDLSPAEVRCWCVARYPQLDIMNGSVISHLERIEAEKRYVSMVSHLLSLSQQEQLLQQPSPPVDNNNKTKDQGDHVLLQEHPRFVELKEKYQNLVVGGSSGKQGGDNNCLASSIINVTIQSLAPSSCTITPVQRRLPDTLTVGRLKALCSRLFGGIDYDLIRLRFGNYYDNDSLPIMMEIDDDEKVLRDYGVSDGAKIYMDETDVMAQVQDLKREQDDQERRMADHDRTITAMKEWKRMG